MTEREIRTAIVRALARVAPEVELDRVSPTENLREALDIDSFDFLHFLIALHEALGVEIPETDYGRLQTLGEITAYLHARLPTPSP